MPDPGLKIISINSLEDLQIIQKEQIWLPPHIMLYINFRNKCTIIYLLTIIGVLNDFFSLIILVWSPLSLEYALKLKTRTVFT